MKKILSITALSLIVLASSCSKKASDNEARLAELKKQQTEIEKEIQKIEEELKASGKMESEKALAVAVEKIEPKIFKHFLEVQGKVDFDQNVLVSSRVAGIITDVRVKRGDKVSAGQVLAKIDATVLEQGIQELKTNLELARTIYQKQKNLWDQKIGTEIQYLTAKSNMESLESKMASLKQQLEQFSIKAPVSGIVDEVFPKTGETTMPGAPVARVINPSGSKIIADIPEAYAETIKKGDEAIVFLPDLNKEISSSIKVVSQAINPVNRTFTVEFGINTAKENLTLKPNMIAVVKVSDYVKNQAIVVPVNIVQKDENAQYVYVAEKQGDKLVAVRREVKSGVSYKGEIEIVEGLKEGDMIITVGYQNVNEGQPVKL